MAAVTVALYAPAWGVFSHGSRVRHCQGHPRSVAVRAMVDSGAEEQAAVRVFYRNTSAGKLALHGSMNGAPWVDLAVGEPVRSSSGAWTEFRVPVPNSANGGVKVDFAVRCSTGCWDNNWGNNYQIEAEAGLTVRVQNGQYVVQEKPGILVVSDIDGTMIGDDATTRRFVQWWVEHAVPRGSKLVYSSGRHLELFQSLLREKQGVMAPPDAYIGSVGTRVHFWSDSGRLEVDPEWEELLEEFWSEQVVKDAAYGQISAFPSQVSFRPKEELSKHKITLNVEAAVLPRVEAGLRRQIYGSGARAELISSGTGGWRYLDIVPANAGKLLSLQYVQECFGFDDDCTVACGDSGNDILMLSGTCYGVMVGNAQEQLLDWAETQNRDNLYRAQGKVADGILEGIEHFGLM